MDLSSIQIFVTITLTELAIKILAAIAFWIIGRWLIGRVIGLVRAGMNRNNVDPTRTKYLGSVVAVALNIALVLGILGHFGIQTTRFSAMLAGAGLAIGAACSGMLGNFAAGAFMLVLRPFKVGDGKVFGHTVMNYSARTTRRVERTAQLAGGVDVLDAMARLKATVAQIPDVVTVPAPEVNLLDMNLVGPVISVRPCCNIDRYWQVYFDTNEAIVRVARVARAHTDTDHEDRAGVIRVPKLRPRKPARP